MPVPASLESGRRALQTWSWQEARAAFAVALSEHESPEAHEGLAIAATWLDDAAAAIAGRERAYRLYRDGGDREAAARVAAGLADAILTFRGEPAVAAGWLQQARRALAGLDDSPVLAWIDTLGAFLAMAYDRDVDGAVGLAESAVEHSRRLGDVDTEMVALSVLGVVVVSAGRFADGMRMLDEAAAAAVSGDVQSPEAAAQVCCSLVTVSVRVRDFDRLAQWSRYVMDLSGDWSNRAMFSYPRSEHAVALTWWGRWNDAERELERVIHEMQGRPLLAALAMLRLADLRRRQGRFEEAAALLADVERRPHGLMMGYLTGAVAAALALDAGDAAKAARLAEGYLRAVPGDDVAERADGLEVLARAAVALGDTAGAARAAEELANAAELIPTRPLRAAARLVEGLVARADGELEAAVGALVSAAAMYELAEAPFEAARARLELGRALVAMRRPEAAAEEIGRAQRLLESLGAAHEVETTTMALAALPASSGRDEGQSPLTPREVEILRLVAAGHSNEEIAALLVLSVRTVERHISNIYAKLGAYGRTARAVATAYAHTHALT